MTRGASLPLALALLLALALVVPQATAHLQGARPILQRTERERIVDLQPDGLEVRANLNLQGEPLRHLVVHHLKPARGSFGLEYRPDGSLPDDAARYTWEIGRMLEYRDVNANGRYDPNIDAATKAWRFTAYSWSVAAIQRVQVGGVNAVSVVWTGNLSGAPQVRLEIVVAGQEFDDEGVRVRPQDVALYLDFLELPPRGVGSLYAFEWDIKAPEGAALELHAVENTTTALVAGSGLHRALFLWGGEALVDDEETLLVGTLGESLVGPDGNRTARLTIHIPSAERSMRFILVSGVEYGVELERTPLPPATALLGLALVALILPRGRKRSRSHA